MTGVPATTTEDARPVDEQPAKHGKGDAAFRHHLTVYLVTGLFLLTLNLLTSPGSLWFYWPLFFWGWALVFQAFATYGAEAPTRVIAILRSYLPAGGAAPALEPKRAPIRRAANAAPFAAEAFASVHDRIQRLKATAWQLPDGPDREQALRICAAADRIAGVMAADRASREMVAWFDAQLLEPATTLLDRYARLKTRGVAGADETLRRVEERNLPQIEARFDALYDQLHRGEIVDLAVASEMLEFDPPEPPPVAPRARA